ncbi:hypothetical protein LCGC14_1248350 [marine sediment metagenome]|uniref:Uncharacterized protein n=1 Tax=marine sediment metagenome TaxID=412755 RepID=A0A0F9LQT0_9ZZZZ
MVPYVGTRPIPPIYREHRFSDMSVVKVIGRRDMHSGSFKAGHDERRGTKGRGKCGRNKALGVLDDLLAEKGNLKLLAAALQDEFLVDPAKFFWVRVVPILPREAAETVLTSMLGFAALTPAEAAEAMDDATSGGPTE